MLVEVRRLRSNRTYISEQGVSVIEKRVSRARMWPPKASGCRHANMRSFLQGLASLLCNPKNPASKAKTAGWFGHIPPNGPPSGYRWTT